MKVIRACLMHLHNRRQMILPNSKRVERKLKSLVEAPIMHILGQSETLVVHSCNSPRPFNKITRLYH
uniref:Uncharacterized protein n=1 Tax=Arundo donax TaxID=35708 RepID=A0A0A9F6W0_ARUDO